MPQTLDKTLAEPSARAASDRQWGAAARLVEICEDPATLFARTSDRRRAALFLVATVLLIVAGTALKVPAFEHVRYAAVPPGSTRIPTFATAAVLTAVELLSAAFGIVLLFAVTTTFAMVFKLAGALGQYCCAVTAIASVQFGLAALAGGLIVAMIGAENFSTAAQLGSVVPSLANIFGEAPPKVHNLLALFEPFKIWAFFLYATVFSKLGGAPRTRALAGAFVVVFAPQALYALCT